jgi:hypothetical protein
MKHYIIVKFTEGTDFHALENPVRSIFEETLSIPGIHGVDIGYPIPTGKTVMI